MTSSGFADGLGRRVLAFDREEGAMLERLVLRPELGAFEAMLRDRLDRLAALEDERIARPRTIERDPDGALVVVSEFVPGSRLSELLETATESGAVPGVDAALGFLLDVLPALCGLHAGAGFAHASITPSRMVLTPAGQIVLLDAIYGGALTHLRYSRRKLWTDFAVATPQRLPAKRIHVEADLAQAALSAVMLMLGRPIGKDEYPDRLDAIVSDVNDIAEIRGSVDFADGLRTFFNRALQVSSSAPYTSADDALFDVRSVASELGLHACRRALVDFIEQMETPAHSRRTDDYADPVADEITQYGLSTAQPVDGLTESEQHLPAHAEPEQDLDAHVDAELDLDSLVEEHDGVVELGGLEALESLTPALASVDEPAADAASHEEEEVDWIAAAAESARDEAQRVAQMTPVPDPVPASPIEEMIRIEPAAASAASTTASAFDALRTLGPEFDAPPVSAPVHATPLTDAPLTEPAIASDPVVVAFPVPETELAEEIAATEEDGEAVPAVRARRAKRGTRSARARKDKLRSAAEHDQPVVVSLKPAASPPPPPAAPSKPASPWLVAPGKAAAFEPVSETPPPPPAPVFIPIATPSPVSTLPATPQFAQAPPLPMYAPPPMTPPVPLAPLPQPVNLAPPASAVEPTFSRAVGAVAPSYDAPPAWTAPPAAPPVAPPPAPVKFKESGSSSRSRRSEPSLEIYSTPPQTSVPVEVVSTPTAFPWKLVAALVIIVVGAVIGGRVYLPAKGIGPQEREQAPATTTTPTTTAVDATPVTPKPVASTGANSGRLEIDTQPAGARVLLDGKPVGDSPVALDSVAVGRHTVTLVSPSGSIKRIIRIEAGRTATLDVPIFSGWVGIFAPFVIQVSEGGRPIGTTEEARLMLTPGKHELTLTNAELGYNASRTVEIEPGEVRSITLDPRGAVNLNASPWAEVWVDGRKIGDTPIANIQLPLGIREVTFRHPQLGERRVSVTVKGDSPSAISINMTKPAP